MLGEGVMATNFRLPDEKDNHILSEAEGLIRRYLEARDGLKSLGVIRTERTFQGDYAEWIVSRMLNLDLSESSVETGIDGRDSLGKTYQIKSRRVHQLSSARTSFDMRDRRFHFDYLAGVFFGPSFEVLGVIRVPYEVVTDLGSQTRSTFRFYWNRRSSRDPRVERLFWAEDSH